MEKYYIYLDGKQYMEMPKEYNIKYNVYMNTRVILGERFGWAGALFPSKRIKISNKYLNNPQLIDNVIRHELRHIKQMEEIDFMGKYKFLTKLFGYQQNPYEVDARNWGDKYLPLHRIGIFDIEHQKRLEKWQKEQPDVFKAISGYEKWQGEYAKTILEQQKKEKTRQDRLNRALNKIKLTLETRI